jgi:CheY-like chemotaxis protein
LSRILVAEDSPAIALLLRRRLEMAGHSVEMAPGGDQALEMLEAANLPDLVLADVMMPGRDGLATLEQIRSRHPRLPVILVTGQQLTAEQEAAADAAFTKPIEFEDLIATISELTAR